MDLYDAMSTLRAVRRIKPDPIPDEVLDRVLRAATWAPSGGNRQCWRMIVVRDPVLKLELEKLYKPHWNEYTFDRAGHLDSCGIRARPMST